MQLSKHKLLVLLNGLALLSAFPIHAANYVNLDHTQTFASSSELNTITNLDHRYRFDIVNSVILGNKVNKIKFNQYYLNVPIWGISLSATQEGIDNYNSLFGDYVNSIENDISSATPTLSKQKAMAVAKKGSKLFPRIANMVVSNEQVRLYIYLDKAKKAHLVYFVSFMVDGQSPTRPHFIIDAHNGKILEQWEGLTTKNAIGPGGNQKTSQYNYGTDYGYLIVTDTCQMDSPNVVTWDLKNMTSGGAVHQFSCVGNPPINTYKAINGAFSPINDAHYFGNIVFNMYKTWFNKSPITQKLKLRIHYGVGYENAFWDGQQMTFGDGRNVFYPLTSIDILGHEVSHGFTEQNSGLIYSKQPGGINEAFSDMAGEATEYFNNKDKAIKNDWLVGAQIVKGSGALRYFADPTKDGVSIGNAKDYNDSMDVHYTSGVFNKAFYTLATKPNWNTEKAFRAFVLANQIYWNQNTNFVQGGCGVMKAAGDLSYSTADVIDAFNVVGVNAACTVDSGTIKVATTNDSDTRCGAASDKLFLDGSASGSTFTVSSGISKVASVGSHTVILSSQTAIPAGGGRTGTCKSTLDKTQVTVNKDQVAPVNAKYVYTEVANDTGTIQVSAASGSDSKCNAAIDTFYLDEVSNGNFTVSSGIAKSTTVGGHKVRLASQASIPSGTGTCKSTLDVSNVTVVKGQISPVKALYRFTDTPPGMSCKIVSSKIISQSDWGAEGIVNTFEIQLSLQNFPKDPSGKMMLDGTFDMKNNFMRNFWGNFSITSSSYNQATGKFIGDVWPSQSPTLSGFISNKIPMHVGDNALVSIKLNGITCQ